MVLTRSLGQRASMTGYRQWGAEPDNLELLETPLSLHSVDPPFVPLFSCLNLHALILVSNLFAPRVVRHADPHSPIPRSPCALLTPLSLECSHSPISNPRR